LFIIAFYYTTSYVHARIVLLTKKVKLTERKLFKCLKYQQKVRWQYL